MSGGGTSFWRSGWRILWKSLVFFLLFALLLCVWVGLFEFVLKSPLSGHSTAIQAYFDAASAVSVLCASWLMVRYIDRRPFWTLGLVRGQAMRHLAVGGLLGLLWLGLSAGVLAALGYVSRGPGNVNGAADYAWAAAALFCNTVAQEGLFRGYFFQTVRSSAHAFGTIVLTSLVFAAGHGGALRSWLPACNVFAAGVLFGLAYERSRSLWLPIGIHYAWNFTLSAVLGLVMSGQRGWAGREPVLVLSGPALLTGGTFGMEGSLVTLLTTILMIAGFWAMPSDRAWLYRPKIQGRTS